MSFLHFLLPSGFFFLCKYKEIITHYRLFGKEMAWRGHMQTIAQHDCMKNRQRKPPSARFALSLQTEQTSVSSERGSREKKELQITDETFS